MKKEKLYNVKLTADEMSTLLQSIENSAYKGAHSEAVTVIKDKLKVASHPEGQ